MKKKIATFLCLVLVFAAVFCFTSCKKEDELTGPEPTSADELSYMASEQGICVLSSCRLKPDSEGTSLSHNDDVAGIIVCNESSKTLQYAEIVATFQGGITHIYKVTTLPPGETCFVEEESYAPYRETDTGFFGFEIKKVAFFTEEPSIHSDKFQFSGADGILNIKNISDGDITDTVVVYYKDYKETQLSSGKTYRVIIEGGIKKGEMKQLIASHYMQNASIIMFVQLVPQEVS